MSVPFCAPKFVAYELEESIETLIEPWKFRKSKKVAKCVQIRSLRG